jgi:beta-aspartyl-dipeptidase (metallo-type)
MLWLLRSARVYAPQPLGLCDLLIAGGQILAIADHLPALPAGLPCQELDLGGARLIPGLIDAHVHLSGGGGEAGPNTRVPPVQLTDLTTAGITTVVGVLGTDGTTRSVADLVARTLGLRDEGLSAYCYTGSYELPVPTLTGSIRRDIVFVDPIIGVGELALSDHRSSQPTFDEFLRIAADAHVAGMHERQGWHPAPAHRATAPAASISSAAPSITASSLPRVFHPPTSTATPPVRRVPRFARRGVTVDVTAFPPDEDPGDGLHRRRGHRSLVARRPPPRPPHLLLRRRRLHAGLRRPRPHLRDGRRPPTTLTDTIPACSPAASPCRSPPDLHPQRRRPAAPPHKGRIAPGADADLSSSLDDPPQVSAVMARGAWLVKRRRPWYSAPSRGQAREPCQSRRTHTRGWIVPVGGAEDKEQDA